MIGKVYRKVKKMLSREHSMLHHPAEKYYFKQYWKYIEEFLPKEGKVLEIGCQEGRFTIPLLKMGLSVEATDVRNKYEGMIRKYVNSPLLKFSMEPVDESSNRKDLNTFDVVLCLELLYIIRHFEQILTSFNENMKSGGLFIGSHRSKGYYIRRYLNEKKWEELHQVIDGTHQVFNGQYSAEILEIYKRSGFIVKKLIPIGTLSGFGNDPFSSIANPAFFNEKELANLGSLENSKDVQKHMMESSRYFLVIAEKP